MLKHIILLAAVDTVCPIDTDLDKISSLVNEAMKVSAEEFIDTTC